LLNTFTGTKAWVKRSDYRTFASGLSNLRTIDTEPKRVPFKPTGSVWCGTGGAVYRRWSGRHT